MFETAYVHATRSSLDSYGITRRKHWGEPLLEPWLPLMRYNYDSKIIPIETLPKKSENLEAVICEDFGDKKLSNEESNQVRQKIRKCE